LHPRLNNADGPGHHHSLRKTGSQRHCRVN
jgi:hypothetical protein